MTMMFKGYVLKEYLTKDCLFLRALSFLKRISNCNQNSVIVPSSYFFLFSVFSLDISFCYRQIKLPHWSCFLRISHIPDALFHSFPENIFFSGQKYFLFLSWEYFLFFAENIFFSFPENISLFWRERFLFFSREYLPFLAHHICFKIESCQLGWDLS